MEVFDANGVPAGWQINHSDLAEADDAPGDVHSGNFSVLLSGDAVLWQNVSINGGCFFTLSFFARGNGALVQLEASVIFSRPGSEETEVSSILIRAQDIPTDNRNFAYYRFITAQAPNDATNARVEFRVTVGGNQALNLDDVSFSID